MHLLCVNLTGGKQPNPYFATSAFAKLAEFEPGLISVGNSLEDKIARLEVMFSEQEYTIQSLNDMIAQQDQEISQLNINLDLIKVQLRELRNELSIEIDPAIDKPPHY